MNQLVRVICPKGQVNCTDTTSIPSEMRVVVHLDFLSCRRSQLLFSPSPTYYSLSCSPFAGKYLNMHVLQMRSFKNLLGISCHTSHLLYGSIQTYLLQQLHITGKTANLLQFVFIVLLFLLLRSDQMTANNKYPLCLLLEFLFRSPGLLLDPSVYTSHEILPDNIFVLLAKNIHWY